MAIMAAIKNVLSPISEARIIPHDFRNPSKKWLSAIICITVHNENFIRDRGMSRRWILIN